MLTCEKCIQEKIKLKWVKVSSLHTYIFCCVSDKTLSYYEMFHYPSNEIGNFIMTPYNKNSI